MTKKECEFVMRLQMSDVDTLAEAYAELDRRINTIFAEGGSLQDYGDIEFKRICCPHCGSWDTSRVHNTKQNMFLWVCNVCGQIITD